MVASLFDISAFRIGEGNELADYPEIGKEDRLEAKRKSVMQQAFISAVVEPRQLTADTLHQ